MRPRDTSPAAYAAQIRVLRELGPAERVRAAVRLSEGLREMVAAGVRHRHPELTPEQVRREVMVRIYGAELVDRVWGARAVG